MWWCYAHVFVCLCVLIFNTFQLRLLVLVVVGWNMLYAWICLRECVWQEHFRLDYAVVWWGEVSLGEGSMQMILRLQFCYALFSAVSLYFHKCYVCCVSLYLSLSLSFLKPNVLTMSAAVAGMLNQTIRLLLYLVDQHYTRVEKFIALLAPVALIIKSTYYRVW